MLHSLRRRPLARAAFAAVAGLGVVAALASCSAQPNVNQELGSISETADVEAWRIDYDSCMSKAGFDLTGDISVTTSEDGTVVPDFGGKSLAEYEEADSECIRKVGEPPVMPGTPTAEESMAIMLEFASCMRAAGYDYPDPEPVSGNGSISSMQAFSADEVNPDDVDACSVQAGMVEPGSTE